MRQHKRLTRTLLILSIIIFALAAPAAVRERPEVRLDAKVTRNVKAASQKLRGLSDESGSTNVPGLDHASSQSPDWTDSTLWQQIDLSLLYSPDSPGPLTGWDPPSPGPPTESRWPVGSMPVAGSPSHSPPPPRPESGSTNLPGPDHAPSSSPDSTDSILRQIDFGSLYSPDSPGSLTGWYPPSPGPPTESRGPVGSVPVAGSPTHSPPPPAPESGSMNLPGPDHAPSSSPDSTDSILRQIDFGPPYSPDNLGSIKEWHYVPPSSGSPTGSRLPVGSTPVAVSLSPPPPESGPTKVPGPGHALVPSLDSTSWEELMRMFGMAKQQGYMDNPSPLSPDSSGSLAGWGHTPPSPGSRFPVGPMPMADSLSPPPPPSSHPSQPGPSGDHFPSPPGFSVSPDTFSSTGPTSNQPTPPQGPEVKSEIHSPLNPEPIPIEFEFWDKLLKGEIKRRISVSDAMNLAQKDPRSRIF